MPDGAVLRTRPAREYMHSGEAVDAGDAVAGFDDRADVDGLALCAELLDLLLEDCCNLFGPDCHRRPPYVLT